MKISGQALRRRGRPAKIGSPVFRLLALAWYARRLSQESLAERVNTDIRASSPPAPPEPLSVTQPAVRRWLRQELPRLARPTVSLKRPETSAYASRACSSAAGLRASGISSDSFRS